MAEGKTTYFGNTGSIRFGIPGGEFYVGWGETGTWKKSKFNIFDIGKKVYRKIME